MMDTVSHLAPWLASILGYGLVAHGVILLNDGLYWDGWLVELWQRHGDERSMRRFYWEVGMPNLYFEHSTMARLPGRMMVYRSISLWAILSMAVLVFLILAYTGVLNPPQATAVSLLLLSYPAYVVTFDGVVSLQYTLKVALFYAACLLAIASANGFDAASYLEFAAALVLFFASFYANSTLVFFWGFMLFYAWLVHAKSPSGFAIEEYAKIVVMGILPFAFWFIKETLFPRHGYYKDYNRIRLTPFSLLQVGVRSFRYGIDVPMLKPVLRLFEHKQATLLLLALALGLIALDFSGEMMALPASDAVKILGVGYGLMLLSAGPFMAVGQGSWEGGWASKNFMLFHLPYALIVFGWLQLVLGAFTVVLIPIILLANAFHIVKVHLLYIAASVKDKALMRWLAARPELGEASVIKIRDAHWIEYPFERKATMYWPAYLSCMVKLIWPERRILAVLDDWAASDGRALTEDEIEQALETTTIRYAFAPDVQTGPQYLVTIAAPTQRFAAPRFAKASDERADVHPMKEPAMARLAIEYLYLKWLSPGRLGDFLDQRFAIGASRL